jgi:hypothetical protein
MEDRIQRARRRFKAMLANAEETADRAALEPPSGLYPSSAAIAAAKAMNRAGGFLEAVSIVVPELGAELIDEFETFALKVEGLSHPATGDGERRIATGRRSRGDRRAWDRRLGRDRRRHPVAVAVDRRQASDRRALEERRTGKIRELADRRLRAVHR